MSADAACVLEEEAAFPLSLQQEGRRRRDTEPRRLLAADEGWKREGQDKP